MTQKTIDFLLLKAASGGRCGSLIFGILAEREGFEHRFCVAFKFHEFLLHILRKTKGFRLFCDGMADRSSSWRSASFRDSNQDVHPDGQKPRLDTRTRRRGSGKTSGRDK